MSEPEQAKAKRVRDVVVDAYIELVYRDANDQWQYGMDRYVAALENAAREIERFLNDHRSRRGIDLHVKKVKQDQCSLCKKEWETFVEDGVTYCAWCGAEVEDEE